MKMRKAVDADGHASQTARIDRMLERARAISASVTFPSAAGRSRSMMIHTTPVSPVPVPSRWQSQKHSSALREGDLASSQSDSSANQLLAYLAELGDEGLPRVAMLNIESLVRRILAEAEGHKKAMEKSEAEKEACKQQCEKLALQM